MHIHVVEQVYKYDATPWARVENFEKPENCNFNQIDKREIKLMKRKALRKHSLHG